MMRFLILFLTLAFGVAGLPQRAHAEKLAVVFGMGAYANITPLANSVKDARGIAATLESIGFEVTLLIDAPLVDVQAALQDFAFQAETAEIALVYFAGHGVEVQGENFLIPVDAAVSSNVDVQAASISLRELEAAVAKARRMGVILLDSCRDNPFGGAISPVANDDTNVGGSTRSAGAAGLAPTDPDRGTVVFYAARHGMAALDGIAGGHSPFAQALIDNVTEPGLEIGVMMRRVRDQVLAATGNLQEPFSYGSLPGTPFYIAGPRQGSVDVNLVADRSEGWAGLEPDQEVILQALAEGGDTRSILGLGYIRMNQNDPSFSAGDARALFEKAAAAGSPEAQFELARLYERGIGGPADPARALELYAASAAQDYGNALNEMGFIHFQGLFGLTPDQGLGIDFFTRAARERDPEAQYNLAALIDDGIVPGRDASDAAALLYQALRSGNARVLSVVPMMNEQFELATRRALQEELRENGFYDGAIDGSIGAGTEAAMRRAFGLEDA